MKLLKIGSRSNTVRKWQRFLIGQGCPLLVDGDFGPKTRDATIEFQEKNGLEPDGKVGNRTMGKAMQLGLSIVEDPDDDSRTGPNWPPRPDFGPLTGTRRRQEIFGRYEFVHEPLPQNRENIRILGGLGEGEHRAGGDPAAERGEGSAPRRQGHLSPRRRGATAGALGGLGGGRAAGPHFQLVGLVRRPVRAGQHPLLEQSRLRIGLRHQRPLQPAGPPPGAGRQRGVGARTGAPGPPARVLLGRPLHTPGRHALRNRGAAGLITRWASIPPLPLESAAQAVSAVL